MNPLRLVLVAMSLVACGPLPVTNGAGGGSAGGSQATGGGSGGSGGSGGGSATGGGSGGGTVAEPATITLSIDNCPSLIACGGAPLPGTWHYSAGCVNNPFRAAQQACGQITFSNLQGTVKGSVVFEATLVTRRVTTNVSGTINVPASCLQGVITCAQMQTQLRQSHPNATCAAAGAGCDCTVSEQQVIQDTSSYSVTGSTITVGSGTYDYCLAPASTLKYRKTGNANVEDGLMTLTRQ